MSYNKVIKNLWKSILFSKVSGLNKFAELKCEILLDSEVLPEALYDMLVNAGAKFGKILKGRCRVLRVTLYKPFLNSSPLDSNKYESSLYKTASGEWLYIDNISMIGYHMGRCMPSHITILENPTVDITFVCPI